MPVFVFKRQRIQVLVLVICFAYSMFGPTLILFCNKCSARISWSQMGWDLTFTSFSMNNWPLNPFLLIIPSTYFLFLIKKRWHNECWSSAKLALYFDCALVGQTQSSILQRWHNEPITLGCISLSSRQLFWLQWNIFFHSQQKGIFSSCFPIPLVYLLAWWVGFWPLLWLMRHIKILLICLC